MNVGERSLLAITVLWIGILSEPAGAQITMDTHIQNTGAFASRGGSAGIITNNVDYRSTVQIPFAGTADLGGTSGGSGSYSSSGLSGRSTSSGFSGGGTGISVRATEVGLDPVGLREIPLAKWPGKQLVLALDSEDASLRISALFEIGRRHWSPKARAFLTRRVSVALRDDNWRVASRAAGTIARLDDPSGQTVLLPILSFTESDRVVAVLNALGQIGQLSCLKRVQAQINREDLEVSVAASRAVDSIRKRTQKR